MSTADSGPGRRRVGYRWWWFVGAVVLGYLALVSLGITTSSIGMPALQSDPGESGVLVGLPQAIRSDEYLRSTPMFLAFMAQGSVYQGSLLAESQGLTFALPHSGVFENLSFFDATILRAASVAPDSMVFAAYWWFPTVVLLLALPYWLRRLGVSTNLAAFATGLVILAPANLWWSLTPVRILGFLFAGAVAALLAFDWLEERRYVAAGLAILTAGVLWSRLGVYYVPWSLVLSPPIIAATFLWIWRTGLRTSAAVITIVGIATTSIAIFVGVLWENRDQLQTLLGTVYPGTRQSGAESTSLGQLFGAPFLFSNAQAPTIAGINQSEISSAFLICLVWAVALLVATWSRSRWARCEASVAPAMWSMVGCAVFWTAWASVDAESITSWIPLLNRVPAKRAAQIVGFLAIVALVFVITYTRHALGRRAAWICTIACGLVSLVTGASMLNADGLAAVGLILGMMAVCIVVAALSWRPRSVAAVMAALIFAVVLAYPISPIQQGLSGLRNGPAAVAVQTITHQPGWDRTQMQIWASDSVTIDALLMANAVPSLSGQQNSGPDPKQWEALDPDGVYDDIWNRGASYVTFAWAKVREPVIKVGTSHDLIVVEIDPCDAALRRLGLTAVASGADLSESSCLSPAGNFVWGGVLINVYRRG